MPDDTPSITNTSPGDRSTCPACKSAEGIHEEHCPLNSGGSVQALLVATEGVDAQGLPLVADLDLSGRYGQLDAVMASVNLTRSDAAAIREMLGGQIGPLTGRISQPVSLRLDAGTYVVQPVEELPGSDEVGPPGP